MVPHHWQGGKSLSSRRAWIEIDEPIILPASMGVALLTESVDRNVFIMLHGFKHYVALLTESVDRNTPPAGQIADAIGRSPHGERG